MPKFSPLARKRIKDARNKQCLTQKELGDQIGIDQSQIHGLESGLRSVSEDVFREVSEFLGLAGLPEYGICRNPLCMNPFTIAFRLSHEDWAVMPAKVDLQNLEKPVCEYCGEVLITACVECGAKIGDIEIFRERCQCGRLWVIPEEYDANISDEMIVRNQDLRSEYLRALKRNNPGLKPD